MQQKIRKKPRSGEAYLNAWSLTERVPAKHKVTGYSKSVPKGVVLSMWYVIQTVTGKEKELVTVIERVLPGKGYNKCFVIQQECVWRLKGQYQMHIEPLFPSYIFVDTDSPKEFFFELKSLPQMTKFLGDGEAFWTVKKEEKELLRKMINKDPEYVIRCSVVEVDSNGNIISAEGILKDLIGKIVKKRLRKRRVLVEIPLLGRKRKIQIGICLKTDNIQI